MQVSEKRANESSGGVLPYMGYIGMCHCEGYGFQAVYSGIGCINQRVWVLVSFSRKLIHWLKILVYTRETGNYHSKSKYGKKQIGKFKLTQLGLKATLG